MYVYCYEVVFSPRIMGLNKNSPPNEMVENGIEDDEKLTISFRDMSRRFMDSEKFRRFR